jgi:hypothetical protein
LRPIEKGSRVKKIHPAYTKQRRVGVLAIVVMVDDTGMPSSIFRPARRLGNLYLNYCGVVTRAVEGLREFKIPVEDAKGDRCRR